jgi:hypothetical protein
VPKELQPLDDTTVEVDELCLGEFVDVDCHGLALLSGGVCPYEREKRLSLAVGAALSPKN